MEDPFIREHIEELLRNIRTQVLVKLIKPYTSISLEFIAKWLNISTQDVESLLVSCILDRKINGKIDQVKQVLEMKRESPVETNERYEAIDKWMGEMASILDSVTKLKVD